VGDVKRAGWVDGELMPRALARMAVVLVEARPAELACPMVY
jgi:hypothetical protein